MPRPAPPTTRPAARTRRATPLADMVDGCLGPALAAQGFAAADVIMAWGEIAGPRLAAYSQPVRIDWPRQARGDVDRSLPATLVVRCSSAFALELQHTAPVIIDRVNTHFGWRCIGRIVIRQGPLPRPAARPARPAPAPAAVAAAGRLTDGIADDGLRAALQRLGAAVLSAGSVKDDAGS